MYNLRKIKVPSVMKIKLRSFDTVIYTEEHIQEVEYLYSIDDSLGILKVELTIPEEADPVEQFVIHIKDIYRGFIAYNIYHNKYKYSLLKDGTAFQLNKIKMY